MIGACLFDLDGTLLDTAPALCRLVNRNTAPYGIRPISEDEVKVFVGDGAKKLIDRTLASRGVNDPALAAKILAAYNADYDAHPFDFTAPYDGIPELIAALRERNIRLAVISNKPDPTAKAVVSHFFGDSFDLVRGGREGYPLKPSPDVPREMLAALGSYPEEAFYFGDTATDMRTGRSLGAAITFGVLWGFRSREELIGAGAEVLLSQPSEALRYFDSFDPIEI